MKLNPEQRKLFIAALAAKHAYLACEQRLIDAIYPGDDSAGESVREQIDDFFNGPAGNPGEPYDFSTLTEQDLLDILNEEADE